MKEELKLNWADYLIAWRTSLWVSIREKESNVWKFVTFYATAVALIIGLGEKYTNTFVVAFVVGVLSFWGLGIVIDSNSWMARNLKLIGNIEKLFVPKEDYGKLIPAGYSSPVFMYFRPYRYHFWVLCTLVFAAYLNFLFHFRSASQEQRWYLLPALTILYVLGLHLVQREDKRTRSAYFWFYSNAKGEPIGLGAETLPPEFLAFRTAVQASFQHWALIASSLILIAYALMVWRIQRTKAAIVVVGLIGLYGLCNYLLCGMLNSRASSFEKAHKKANLDWVTLSSKTILWNWKLRSIQRLQARLVTVWAWLLVVGFLVLFFFGNLSQLKALLS